MKRSPMKRSRSKPRPARVKGVGMKRLREAAYLAHCGKCMFCGRYVAFEEMHLAHIKAKRRHGDDISNVAPAHPECHMNSHSPKACPPAVWRKSAK